VFCMFVYHIINKNKKISHGNKDITAILSSGLLEFSIDITYRKAMQIIKNRPENLKNAVACFEAIANTRPSVQTCGRVFQKLIS